jgi:hypothetical protein
MLFYRATLPLSRKTLTFAAGIIRRHRALIGSCWRELNLGQQALLVLAHLREGETFAGLAVGFGVGTATAWRYVNETVALLAARAPELRTAIRAGYAYVVLDGTLVPIDWVAADLQVIASPAGDIVWVSGALPGAVHDKKAEWIWGVLAALEAAGLIVLGRHPGRPPRRARRGDRDRGRVEPERHPRGLPATRPPLARTVGP